jgi:mannose-6-phosphate isomerase
LLDPIQFHPLIRPLVWGGRRLGEDLGKQLPPGEACGESWEISDHASHASVVDGGTLNGQTLRQLMHGPAWLLGQGAGQYSIFPWLMKFLDARDWLSVQVHPDEEAVKRLWPGEGAKTESWFVLDALPESRIYAGLQPGVDEAVLRAALAEGSVADCLHSFHPRPGDCLFLPAGTVHAVGGGVLLAEVQQTSDATFRLFDWNRRDAQGRSRTLHIEQALACIDYRQGPVTPIAARGYPQALAEAGSAEPVCQRLVQCPYFVLEYIRETEVFELPGGSLQVLVGLHGRGWVQGAMERVRIKCGRTLLLPAIMEKATVVPEGPLGLWVAALPESSRVSAD